MSPSVAGSGRGGAGRDAEVRGQAERDARAAGDEGVAGGEAAEGAEVVVGDGVGDDQPLAARGCLRQRLGAAAGAQGREREVADLVAGLAGEPAAQVGVGHRVERMALHAALAEEPVADEEVALVDRAPGVGKGRADEGDVAPEEVEERGGDRPDVALAASSRRSSST